MYIVYLIKGNLIENGQIDLVEDILSLFVFWRPNDNVDTIYYKHYCKFADVKSRTKYDARIYPRCIARRGTVFISENQTPPFYVRAN